MNPESSLADIDPDALRRAERLGARVVETVRAAPGGVIGFDEYMAQVLYAPDLGYYASDNPIFGAAGDFVTAPESGSLFGRCLARQVAEVLDQTGGGVLEFGAGSGALAATLLGELRAMGLEPAYSIVEPSAALRSRQHDALAGAGAVEWRDAPPAGFVGCVIANEVLDAMPARRYVVRGGEVCELGVGLDGDALVFRLLPGRSPPAVLAAALSAMPDGYCTEALPGLDEWCRVLAGATTRAVVLIADYGYPRHEFLHPSRREGTLKCHFRHQVHDDPFALPGLQDVTTSVDFTALAESATACGLELAGYVTQAEFLIACGLESLLAAPGLDEAARYGLAQEAKRLLLPGQMGEAFKIMALTRGGPVELCGFRHDQRHRLDGFAPGDPR
ncbi:MAG: class I SAM-dependent methyltransferase [Gammaproteobacteria bacterium]